VPDDRGLILPAAELQALRAHAAAVAPEECCGVLIGRSSDSAGYRVVRSLAAENAWPGERRERYEIPPERLLEAMKSARAGGLEVVGYYHSHPQGEARPSRFDRERAWPGLSYLILAPRAETQVRSWRLAEDGGFEEQPVVVER
jgi:proteasome lid subunit RPN8/RPN11